MYAWKTGGGMFPMTYKGRTRMVRMGKPGVADIIGWKQIVFDERERPSKDFPHGLTVFNRRTARFLACEVKRRGEKPTVEQQAFLDRVKAAGGIALVAYDVADVRKVMEP